MLMQDNSSKFISNMQQLQDSVAKYVAAIDQQVTFTEVASQLHSPGPCSSTALTRIFALAGGTCGSGKPQGSRATQQNGSHA